MDSYLQEKLRRVIFYVGDIVIDMSTGNVGILLNRERHIDIIEDDMYFWNIKWTREEDLINIPVSYMEEEHLKFLILIDKIKWQSIKGGNCDLRMECL